MICRVGNAHRKRVLVGIAHPTRPKIFEKSNIIPIGCFLIKSPN